MSATVAPRKAIVQWLSSPREDRAGVLALDGTLYTVAQIQGIPPVDGKPVQGWKVRKVREDGTLAESYQVFTYGLTSECDCPDHVYRARECKHIQGVQALTF